MSKRQIRDPKNVTGNNEAKDYILDEMVKDGTLILTDDGYHHHENAPRMPPSTPSAQHDTKDRCPTVPFPCPRARVPRAHPYRGMGTRASPPRPPTERQTEMTPTPSPTPETTVRIPHDLMERAQGYADRLGRTIDDIITDALIGMFTDPGNLPCKAHHGLGLIAEARRPRDTPRRHTHHDPQSVPSTAPPTPHGRREIIQLLTETIAAIQADPH